MSNGLQSTSDLSPGVYTLPTLPKSDTWKRAIAMDSTLAFYHFLFDIYYKYAILKHK